MPTHLRLPAVILHGLHWRFGNGHVVRSEGHHNESPLRSTSRHFGGAFLHLRRGSQSPVIKESALQPEHRDALVFKSYIQHDKWLLLHKLTYLILCIGWVSFMPFLPLFLSTSGMSPAVIGVILALRPLCILAATPLFGALADKGYRRVVLVGSIVASSILRAAIVL